MAAVSSFEDILDIAKTTYYPNTLRKLLHTRYGISPSAEKWQQIARAENLGPESIVEIQQNRIGRLEAVLDMLREEINKVDDWANGIYAALRDVLMHQLRESPELGKTLAKNWSRAARDFDRIHVQGQPARKDEPLEFLEARKMYYRVFSHLGVMPKVE